MVTNVFQRRLELLTIVLPLNVFRATCPSSWRMPNFHRIQNVRDRVQWKIAAADNRNDYGYAYYNKPEFYR